MILAHSMMKIAALLKELDTLTTDTDTKTTVTNASKQWAVVVGEWDCFGRVWLVIFFLKPMAVNYGGY